VNTQLNNANSFSARYGYSPDVASRLIEYFGNARAEKIIRELKTPSRVFTVRVNTLLTSTREVLSELEKLSIKAEAHPIVDEAILLEVKGPFPIRGLGKKIVADKFACESVMQGSDLYSPGVIRLEKIKKNDLVVIEDKTGLRVAEGIARMSSKEIMERVKGVAVEITNSIYKVPNLKNTSLYSRGLVYLQSLPSIIASKVLEPDRSKKRLEKLKNNVKRLGVKNVTPICLDARLLNKKYPNLKADRILVDPPCTAIGVRPKLYEETTEKQIISASLYQRQFLKTAAKMLKPGGTMVYSTCTLTVEENELNVKYCVEELGLDLKDLPKIYGEPGFSNYFHDAKKTWRFHPDTHGTPAGFIAALIRP